MDKKHKLAAFLHLLSSILFWFFIFFLTFDTALNLFFENSEIKTGENSKIANSKGYAIPMKVSLNLKKEGYIYKKGGTSVQIFNDEELNELYIYRHYKKEFIEEIKSSYDEKRKTGSNFILADPEQQGNFAFTNRAIDSKTRIIVKPKTTFLTIMLFLDKYHSILITILILYFLKQIFYHLKKDLNFNVKVSINVKRIGILLILAEILGAIFNIIIGRHISLVNIETEIFYSTAFDLSLNPTIEFDLPMFITGLSLLVVSILLNKGNDLQTESNLTI